MTDFTPPEESTPPSCPAAEELPIVPSWKPLYWAAGILTALVALWEIFLDLGMDLFELLLDLIEHAWLILVEAPEELLEDQIENWLKRHYPHDADRYSELITVYGLTPLKAVLVLLLLRWLWRKARTRLLPRIALFFRRHYAAVRLAWQLLAWPYKALGAVVVLGLLVILI